MRKTLLIGILTLVFCSSKAQYTIPDTAFATALQNIVPNAMTGNVLDENHPDVLALAFLDVANSNIADLDGLQHFTLITDLDCSWNQLTSLPSLPTSLLYIDCEHNQLTALPTLPNALIALDCDHNYLTFLPTLPNSLIDLYCSYNQLSILPSLPNSLLYVDCGENELTTLPTLPNLLNTLDCAYNQLTFLPILPNSFSALYCNDNQLTTLPSFPNSLTVLICDGNELTSIGTVPNLTTVINCGHNQLTALPALPPSLQWLACDNNLLTSLPALPNSLSNLTCSGNPLTALPTLPSSIGSLYCINNQLSSLPNLPNSIYTLYCSSNQLTTLPTLPTSLINLRCTNNQLSALPALPNSLEELICSQNQLNSLPTLPNALDYLNCVDNQLSCLPVLPNSLIELDCCFNMLNCLPNLPTSLNIGISDLCFPLTVCNVNTAPCPIMQEAITGMVFHDDNGNGQLDTLEPAFTNAVLEAQAGNYFTVPDDSGKFVLPVMPGTFVFDGQEVLYHIKTTEPDTITLGVLESDTLNEVGYQRIPNIYDLVVDIEAGPARPGFENNLWLSVQNIGTESTMAVIDLTFDDDQTWVSSDSLPDTQVGNAASWTPIVAPGELWQNRVVLYTDDAVPLGTPIQHVHSALPQMPDTTPVNNSDTINKVVIGAFDPNNKLNEPSSMMPIEVMNGEYIEYTINFQNTGTFPAERVVITDTLSTDLDWSSMEYISGSHINIWYLQNGVLHFVHDPIFLPDSNSNEPESHGYVKFRMKPVSTLMAGEQIENVANIYFDFNEPVITDPAIFEVSISTEISEFENVGFKMYPNPTNGNVTITANDMIRQIEVLQLDGRVVHHSSIGNSKLYSLGTGGLASGIYLVSLKFDTGNSKTQLLLIQ